MEATMSNALAVKRIAQKIEYLKSKLDNPATDDRTRHFAALDITSFEMALDALRYVHALAEYEATQQTK